MTISDLVPNLQPMVEDLSQQLRFICYFVLTAAIVVRTGRGSTSIGQLVRPIVTNIILCGIIATLSMWFNLVRDEFWNIAVSIRTEFTGSVDGTGAALMQLIQPPDTGIDWLDVGNSLMKAVQYALGWLIVWIGGLIQLPMMIVQFVMECLCYLFLPIAISLFAFESTKGLAIRYVQQTLAILAWPIGFAVVDLVGYSLLTSGTSVVSAGAPGKFGADGNGDVPKFVADQIEPHGERGDNPAEDNVGDNGPDQLADAGAAPAGPHDDGRREDEIADEPQLLAEVFNHRLQIRNEITDGHTA
jgi:hypothetical protein